MAILNDRLGGTDASQGDPVFGSDITDTINALIDKKIPWVDN